MSFSEAIKAEEPFFNSLLPQEVFSSSPPEAIGIRLMVCEKALDALQAFKERQMSVFDGSMGDQACQIRALQLCLLPREELKESFKEARKVIELCTKELIALQQECGLVIKNHINMKAVYENQLAQLVARNTLLNQERQCALESIPKGDPRVKKINIDFGALFAVVKKEKEPIEQQIALLEKACIEEQKQKIFSIKDPQVNSLVLFLTRSYCVNLAKKNVVTQEIGGRFVYQQHTNVKKFQKRDDVILSAPLLLKMIEKAKRAVCKASVFFVQQQANYLSCENHVLFRNILATPRLIPDKEREELPFFHMTRVIFERAFQEKIPIILKVRPLTSHPFEEDSYGSRTFFKVKGEAYQAVDPELEDLKKPAIVIESLSSLEKSTLSSSSFINSLFDQKRGLLETIDLNAVHHTQYTDQKISSTTMFDAIISLDPSEKERMITLFKRSFKEGFSISDPKMYCIDHVFCDVVKNQMIER